MADGLDELVDMGLVQVVVGFDRDGAEGVRVGDVGAEGLWGEGAEGGFALAVGVVHGWVTGIDLS